MDRINQIIGFAINGIKLEDIQPPLKEGLELSVYWEVRNELETAKREGRKPKTFYIPDLYE